MEKDCCKKIREIGMGDGVLRVGFCFFWKAVSCICFVVVKSYYFVDITFILWGVPLSLVLLHRCPFCL